MKQYKVCVYAICKNEEKFVDRWMDSMCEADMVIVTDTGSEDNTVEKLRARGAEVYIDIVKPWRFDTARNISLGHVPDDADICVCTDLDEVFLPGWRRNLEKAWYENSDGEELGVKKEAKTGRYLYNWSVKPDGSPGVQFTYFKIHERTGFTWEYPIHECVTYKGNLPLKKIFLDGVVLNHYPDESKPRSSYLPLLEMAVKESPADDRMVYYLGREYMYAGKWEACIDTLKKHLSLPRAYWNEERCASMRWIARSYNMLGNQKEAYCWYMRAIAEAPHMRDPYIEFAKLMYQSKNWDMLYFLVCEALKINEKSDTYVNMEYSWDYTPYDLGALACYNIKLFDIALEFAGKALELKPGDSRLSSNYEIIKISAAKAFLRNK